MSIYIHQLRGGIKLLPYYHANRTGKHGSGEKPDLAIT